MRFFSFGLMLLLVALLSLLSLAACDIFIRDSPDVTVVEDRTPDVVVIEDNTPAAPPPDVNIIVEGDKAPPPPEPAPGG